MKRISWLLLVPAFLLTLFSAHPVQAQQRRGWSPQAKGAVIGGAAGVLGGVLINGRNRKVGGLIGGLGGAAAGYGVGTIIDHKQKKKAAELAAARAAAAERQREAEAAAANERQVEAEHAAAAQRAAAARTTEERTAANTQLAAAERAHAKAVAATASATSLLAVNTTEPTVADGYLPNPQYGVAGTAYPTSRVLRKSW